MPRVKEWVMELVDSLKEINFSVKGYSNEKEFGDSVEKLLIKKGYTYHREVRLLQPTDINICTSEKAFIWAKDKIYTTPIVDFLVKSTAIELKYADCVPDEYEHIYKRQLISYSKCLGITSVLLMVYHRINQEIHVFKYTPKILLDKFKIIGLNKAGISMSSEALVLKPEDIANELGIDVKKVTNLIKTGRIPGIKIGGIRGWRVNKMVWQKILMTGNIKAVTNATISSKNNRQ